LFFTLLIPLLFTGCVPKSSHTHFQSLAPSTQGHDILLMPMDVELSILNAGGILEPQAEWTARAQQNLTQAFQDKMNTLNCNLIPCKEPEAINMDRAEKETHGQLLKLHSAVGYSILTHQYNPMFSLPAKKGSFDWSLGPEARLLKDKYNADYALFVFMRDSYASSGRVAYIVVAAVFGVGVPGGNQIGFASLVDLNTGQIVWFNRLARGAGDLRTQAAARESVEALLQDFPL
jgi:hypothetical protein